MLRRSVRAACCSLIRATMRSRTTDSSPSASESLTRTASSISRLLVPATCIAFTVAMLVL